MAYVCSCVPRTVSLLCGGERYSAAASAARKVESVSRACRACCGDMMEEDMVVGGAESGPLL